MNGKKLQNIADVFVAPGEFHFAGGHTRLRTLLGSCVAVTLWHPQRCIGGLCHIMLPGRRRSGGPLDAKYADEAVELVLTAARREKSLPSEYHIKLFGGGNMFPDLQAQPEHNVAARNIAAARAALARYGLSVLCEDLGSAGHRNIIFELWSGDVWVKYQSVR